MNILEKYNHYRPMLKAGDIILCDSNKPIAKAIKYIDKAQFHHSEIVDITRGRVMGIGAHPEGCRPDFLSHRIKDKNWNDFAILRPQVNIKHKQRALNKAYAYAEVFNKYDYKMLLEVTTYQTTGIELHFDDPYRQICSELTQMYGIEVGAFEYEPENLDRPMFTPMDHFRIEAEIMELVIDFGW